MDATLFQKGIMPMVIAVSGILAPVLIVGVVLWFRHQKQEALYALVRDMATKGLPIPRELLDPPARSMGPTRLAAALTLVGAGAGLAVMFWTMKSDELVGIGALPGLIGVGQLVALALESRLAGRREPQA